jgi:glycosyltransferase involved in cell wall biosynthesis
MSEEQAKPGQPDLIPGLEDFWSPDESLESIEQEVEKLPPKYATGRALPNDYGVVYRGPFETMSDGVCIAVRRNAFALRRAKLPVFLQSRGHLHWNDGIVERTYYGELPAALRAEVDHITEPKHARTVVWFEHFVPTLDLLIALTSPSPLGGDAQSKALTLKSTVAYVAIEHSVLPSSWVDRFNMFARVLVPCQANRDWLIGSGVTVPVDVVPHPLGLKDPMRSVKAQYKGGTFRFLHVGKWEPRKAQHRMLGGFLLAFKPGDDVQLVLKCNPYWNADDYPRDVLTSLQRLLKPGNPEFNNPNGWTVESASKCIRVIWNMLFTREEMAKLYGVCHAYVQSGLTEGFDLACLDAKVAGLRVAGVGWGGPKDFLHPVDDLCIPWEGFALPPKGYRCPEGVTWPDPKFDDYAMSMSVAYDRRSRPVVLFDATPYLIDAVGAKLRAVATEMASTIGVDLSTVEAK